MFTAALTTAFVEIREGGSHVAIYPLTCNGDQAPSLAATLVLKRHGWQVTGEWERVSSGATGDVWTATIIRAAEPNSNKIFAPWTDDEVTALNDYQARGEFHPFTCGAGQRGEHVSGVSLVATNAGWRCPFGKCDYTQDWAWTFMARGEFHSER